MEELNITEPQADVQVESQVEQTPTGDGVSDYFNEVVKPANDFSTEQEFRDVIKNNPDIMKSYWEEVAKPRNDFSSFEEFSSFLNIGGVGKTQPYLGKTQVGQKEGSLKQDGLGLGLEKLQKVTGRTILPSDLTGSQLKQLSKQFNIPSFVSYSDQQYDELAKKLRGKSFYQAQIETAKTLPNRVEARKMTRSAYKGIKNELAADQQLLEDDINQVQQNIDQFNQQLTELKSVFEDVNQPQQIREAAANDFNEIQKQANDLISQSQPKIDAYNENQKTLASLGRLTEPKEVRKQINNGLDAWLAANPYSPLNNPLVKGVSNAIVPSFLNTAAAIIDNPIMRMGYTDSGKLTADVLSNTLFEAAKGATITTTAEEEKSVFDELTPDNVQYTIGNLLGYIIPSATGAGIVSKAAAPITSQLITGGQVYGNYYKEGLDAGLSKNEAALFASVPTIVTAYLGDKGVEMMLAGLSKQGVKSIIREAAKSSIGKSPSEIMKIAGNASKGFLEGVLKEGSQEGVEQLSEMVSKDVANNFADAKFEGDFTIDGYLRGVAEASTLGAVVGGPLGGISGLSSSRNIADVAAQSLVDPNEEFTFRKTLQSLLQDGEIGQDEYDNVTNQFEVAKLAAQKIPNQVTDSELRTEATELIQEKEALNAEIQTKDPAMTTSLKNRVAEIDKRLGEISEGKAVAVEEEQTAPEEGLTVEEIKQGFQEQLNNVDISSPKAGQITSDIILDYIVAGNADSVEAAIDSGKPVDGKEASMLLDSLYTALARVDESVSMTAEQKADLQGILEPLISKIEGYDNITEGTTIKVAERQATARPVEDARKVKDQASAIENSRGKKGVLIRPSRRNPNQRVKEKVKSIDPATIPIESEVSIVRDDAGEIVGYSFTLPDGNELFVDDPGGGVDLALMQKNEIMGAPPQLMEQVFEDVMREVEVAAPTTKTETTKPTEDAVQEQTAGQVPVQPEAGVSETMAEGKPEAEPQVTPTEGQAEQAQATTEEKKEVNVSDALNIINALNEQTPGQTNEAPRTYTTKNIDRAINDARKAKDAKLEKALVDAKAIMKALGKKDTKVVIHFNQGSYTQSVVQAGGEAQTSGSSGFVISKDGNTIHLNLPKIKSNEVVLHEGAHPVLDWITKNNPERIDALYTELESLAQVLPGVNDAIAFSKKYGNTTQAKKEAIVQFMALVADGTINLSEANPTFKQKAIEFIKKLLQAIGIDFGVKISDDASVVELAKRFTESVKYGREISVASKTTTAAPQFSLGDGTKKLSNEEISNLVDSYRGDTDELVKLSDTVSIQKRGNEYFVTAMRDTGVLYTFRPMNLAEAKIFAENNLYKENAGSNINPKKYSPQQKRAQNLKIGDIYTRTINGSRYVFQLMSDFRKDRLNGQFFNADVKVLDVGKQTLRKELSSDGKIKTFGYSVGQTTIDRFKNMDSPNGFNLGEVTVINDFESKPTTGPQFSLGGAVPISDVITALRNAGATEQVIADALKQSGYYTQEEINDAMGLPAPQPTPMIQPPVIPPSFGVEPENGTNQRVNSIYERMALKAESEGNLELAAEIRRRGLYNQRSTDLVKTDSELLISSFNDDIEAAADFVMNNPINGDIRTYVLGQRATRAKQAAISNPTAENLAARNQAIYDFAAYTTDLGQATNAIKLFEEDNPDLFYLGRFSEYIATLANNLGNPAVTTTNASKVVKAAKEVVKLRKDILNKVANVISEMADDATIDSLMIDALELDKAGKNRVLTNKMRNGLRKIVGSVESKKIIGEKLKRLAELGVFGLEETRDEVKELIRKGLAEINPTLQTPLDTNEIQEMAEMFMIIYEEMATQKMEGLLDKAFNGNNKNNAAVTKAVMYGALDTPNALNKFGQKFGLSYITPQMQQQLRNAAQQVANARGNAARSVAQAAFTSMFNNFIYQSKPAGYKILSSLRSFFNYFENIFYNTALFAINTFDRASQGNILRTFGNILNAVARRDFKIIADSFKDVYRKKEVSFNYTDRNGNVQSIDAKTLLVFDDVYSSLRGLPRLAEVKRAGGLNQVEIDIRNTDSRLKRRLLRTFAVPASRIMGAVDATVMPLNMFLTKRQAFYDVLKAFYKDKGIAISEAQLRTQLNDILGVDTDYISKAMEQAVVDVMGSKLWTDLGFTNTDEFPVTDPRLTTGKGSRESKIYNEFLFRTREILDSEENKRLQDSFSKMGYGGLMTPTESDLMSASIDNYAIRVSSELAFLGTPRGSLRVPAEAISKLSNKFLPLKYAGLAPLFTNAAFNSAGMAIRVTPGLNIIQYLKYLYTGTRGGYSKESMKEFGSDYEALTKIDQNKMLRTVLLTNAAFVIAAALKPYDDKEEEIIAINNKMWTGSTPLKLTKAQTDLGYLPGRIYINGKDYDYRDNPLALLISSISFVRNFGLWSFDSRSNNFYAEDDGEIGYSPEFIDQAGAYGLFITASMLELSTIKDMSKTYSDLIEILSPPTGEDDVKQSQLLKRFLEKKGANIIRTSIPYTRFIAEMKTISDAIMNNDKKLPITFVDNIVFGHAIEDNVIKTNGYDFFGRPVKDAFTLILPFVSSVSINQDQKVDREHRLYRKMNYTPKLFLNDRLPVHITLDDLNGDANRFEDFFKRVKEEEKKKDGLVEDVERKSMTEQRVLVSLAMSKEEANLANQKACEFAGKFVEENFINLQDMDMSRFKDAMNSIYNIGREVAIYQNFGNLIEYDKADYYSMINNKIIKFKNTYVGSEMDNLSWPQEFEPSSILGDSFETEPKVKL